MKSHLIVVGEFTVIRLVSRKQINILASCNFLNRF